MAVVLDKRVCFHNQTIRVEVLQLVYIKTYCSLNENESDAYDFDTSLGEMADCCLFLKC